MKILAVLVPTLIAGTALAQPAPTDPYPAQTQNCQPTCPQPQLQLPAAQVAQAQTQPAPEASAQADDEDTGWHRPAGQRFTSGFRLGWMYIANMDKMSRLDDSGKPTSLKEQFGLKNPNMFLIGYEGFYRIVGHSWLNVLMVGNVSVAGLDQSKFIPTASGLLGFEIERQVELGVGVNLTPDSQAPSHMILAVGWTPRVGSIQTPIHFFYIPDAKTTDSMGNTIGGNSRMGATIGMNW